MRILFLDQYSELGGAQQTLLETVDAVLQAGWDPRVLVPGSGPLLEALRLRHVPIREIPCGPYRSGSKSIADSLRFATDLRRQVGIVRDEIAGANIDLIYVNGPRLLAAAALAVRGQAPLVFHVHNHLRGAARRLTHWIIHSAKTTVAGCSNSVLAPFRDGAADRSFHVIPNGVGDAGYRERYFDFERRVRIGMIGRIAPEKGQMEFVNAAALLKDEFPQARFVICGAPVFQAGDDYFQAARRRARGLPVEFVGWQENISSILGELDLLAVPSLEEGMGRVVLEAFSAGVPVVAFPAGGIPEAVIDGVTGFLTLQFSSAALAERIREVLAMNPESVRQVIRNARKAWARSYNRSAYQQRITNVLETLAIAPEVRAIEMPLQPR